MNYLLPSTYLTIIPVSFCQILHYSFIFLDVVRTKMFPPITDRNLSKLFYVQYQLGLILKNWEGERVGVGDFNMIYNVK